MRGMQGIRSARLPIRQHLQMTGTHVLTVNQVFQLLLEHQQCKDWKAAILKVIPGRKHAISVSSLPQNKHAGKVQSDPALVLAGAAVQQAADHIQEADQKRQKLMDDST